MWTDKPRNELLATWADRVYRDQHAAIVYSVGIFKRETNVITELTVIEREFRKFDYKSKRGSLPRAFGAINVIRTIIGR